MTGHDLLAQWYDSLLHLVSTMKVKVQFPQGAISGAMMGAMIEREMDRIVEDVTGGNRSRYHERPVMIF